MVLHVPENVIVDVAEEVDMGLDTPVVLHVSHSRVLVEQPTVPAAHLVIGQLAAVLDAFFLEDLRRVFVELHADMRWRIPVFLWNQF